MGEGTETLACGKAAQPSGPGPALAFQRPGLLAADGVPFDRCGCEGRARSRSDLTIRIRRSLSRSYDEAGPQLSLAASAAGTEA